MLNIYTLHYFYVTAQHLNFSKAAKHLYITQPALSKQIQQLEDQLQVKLFDRTKRSVKLTDAGQVLTDHCRTLFQTIADLEEAMEQFRDEVRGNLRVASTPSLGNYVLPDFLKLFSNRFPQIMLHTIFKPVDDIVHMLRTGELDFGLLATAENYETLNMTSISGQRLVFICSSNCDHPCATSPKTSISPQELETCRFINFEKRSLTRRVVDELARDHQFHLNGVAESENIEIIKSMVIRGMGGAIVPECTIRSEKDAKLITVKDIEGVRLDRPVSLYYSKDLRLSKAHREFLRIFESFQPGTPEPQTSKPPLRSRRKRNGTDTTEADGAQN
jgi:DNA-binding transcriptional LysR family regulator